MIYCLTMNPSVDCRMELLPESAELVLGKMNRADSQNFSAAGKGVNVSRTLSKLEAENTAVCLCGGGFVGREFKRLLDVDSAVIIDDDDNDMRLNIKIGNGSETTEINGSFNASAKALSELYGYLDGVLTSGDILALCGSTPVSAPYCYAALSRKFSEKGVVVIADASGKSLKKLPGSKPFLVKPNADELSEIFENAEIQDFAAAEEHAKELINRGCQNVLVSMGEKGAVLVTPENAYVSIAEKVKAVRTVGAGDALLAGFIREYTKSGDLEKALRFGVATGTRFVAGNL